MSGDTIRVTLRGRELEIPPQRTVGEIIQKHDSRRGAQALAAIVHQRCVDLSFPVCASTDILPVDYSMREGVLVYRRTASLLLFEAARQLFPTVRVSIGQALGNGYFYDIRGGDDFSQEDVERLDQRMRELVREDIPLITERVTLEEARNIFRELGYENKLCMLKALWKPFVELVRCGEFCDIHHSPVAPSARHITSFELVYQPPGVILRFPPRGKLGAMSPYQQTPKLFQVYRETRQWNEILGAETVGQLNELIARGEVGEVIRVSEGLHEKKVAQIADKICQQIDRCQLVLIAGPSASGKTTFSKRLTLQLRVNGIRPVSLSMDNFYVDREETPRDRQGNFDFEAIEAIDLELFNEVLVSLLRGQQVMSPRFDFTSGKRRTMDRWIPMKLEPGQVLMVEGIHGLNDRLTEAVPAEKKYKIYVSALTQLCIDDHNRIFTSDTRFLRRIVRDRLFRGYSAASTIENWTNVRRGEMKHIFPFQEQADVMFNSALVYEQAALRPYAERFLLEVPQDHPSFVDAYRMLRFLEYFFPLVDERVPQISILREFMGGSFFKY